MGKWLSLLCLLVLTSGSAAAADILSADRRWAEDGVGGVPQFTRHIQPLLGKAGCSNRACHGSFQGQGGFRLSLFASDPKLDYDNLANAGRIDTDVPDESLAIQKPTRTMDHEGGLRFAKGSWQHRMLRAWIAAGAPYKPENEATIERLEISPASLTFSNRKETAKLRVVARFSDATKEDVTALTQFSANDDRVAAIHAQGEVVAEAPGDTALIATFGGAVQSVSVLVPFAGGTFDPHSFPPRNPIDERIAERLAALRIPASGLASDEEFLRRVSLDITGTLPTPDEIRAFLAAASPDKRTAKINELLDRPAYVQWWTTRLCDVTGLNAPLFLGNTDFGPLVGDMWRQWMERQVRDNTAYDKIAEGMIVANSRHPGESYDEYSARMASYVLTKQPADFATETHMPHFWFRENLKTPEEKALGVAYTFLGVRLECAQCHKHPFDRWTQQDFQQFAALFSRVTKGVPPESQAAYDAIKGQFDAETLRTAATRRQTYWKLARQGEKVPWPEVFVSALGEKLPKDAEDLPPVGKLLGGATVAALTDPDPRVPLMAWLRARDNPYFAPAFVNRIWAHYFGRGLVNPPDDFNLANPPSHPELLAELAAGFRDSGFDMKWLHRQIAGSRTYQLTWRPLAANRDDERNYSHAAIRRLPAEVLIDAVQQATAGVKEMAEAISNTKNRRIGVQATADLRRTEYGLAVFGKPLRKVNCDCEREMEPSLLQAVYLRNDPDLAKMLDRPGGWISQIKPAAAADDLIAEAFLRVVSRLPGAAEKIRCREYLSESPTPAEGLRDVAWSLLNTQEFITNH
jgi:Protein of unknown function (DUF1553)/Protein of unknown function (DUF1549)